MNHIGFRCSLSLILLALSGGVAAVGLGELRGQPTLGAGVRVEIDILGAGKGGLDAACFRIVPPANAGELPWLKKANLSVRQASPPVLEIRSEIPLREPVIQLAVQVACGHEISREYVLFASPSTEVPPPMVRERSLPNEYAPTMRNQARPVSKPRQVAQEPKLDVPERLMPRKALRQSQEQRLPDRILLSDGGVGEPSLRLATDLAELRGKAWGEAQREIMRLEYRMLIALNEQATSQLATAEKLRSMESTLGELAQRTTEFAQRVEKGAVPPDAGAPKGDVQPLPVAEPARSPEQEPPKPRPAPVAVQKPPAQSIFSEWSLYGVVLGAGLGLAGWFGWRKYREHRENQAALEEEMLDQDIAVDPKKGDEFEELGGVDLRVEPAAMGMPMQVDVDLGAPEAGEGLKAKAPPAVRDSHDSMFSISAATVDEHFEANPVMELADIMLSFGRVKGAAQALQEYIDNNPQEALQPWIRLMEVYRMAGMREEFEAIARNLNQNFNVEVQQWEEELPSTEQEALDIGLGDAAEADLVPKAPRPKSIEDMPRLMNTVLEMWAGGDVIGYLYQLLRDNRDGKRQGFALPVVEEILFLIELKETANRME